MSRRLLFLVGLLLCLVTSLMGQQSRGPIVRTEIKHDVSPPLRDLIRSAPRPISNTPHEFEPARRLPIPPGLLSHGSTFNDPVHQRSTSTVRTFTPTVGLGFDGLGNGQYGFSVTGAPPDTNGAVGATQYVQWVNTSYAIFNKSTGALVAGPTAGNTIWSGFGGGCQSNNDGDPIVLYDQMANRWVMSQFSVSTTPYLQCIAVSTTSDATGTYNRYSFQYSNFDDYPKMGIWPDAYYETFNMFNGNTFVGADACAYNRTAMLNGTTATQVCFQQGSGVGGLLPASMDGSTQPPAGSPEYFMYYGTNALELYKFHVNFTTPSSSTFTGPTNIAVASFSPACNGGTCIPQPGTTNQLDSLADRLMYRLAYRNFGSHESLVVSHAVTAGSSVGMRWYEIQNPSGTPTVAQQGTFAPDSNYRWMGSVAMDSAGDMALGYSVSSSSVDPSIRYTGRVPSDPSGTMEAETTVVTGTGVQNGTLTRWGDYSAMQIDPSDDCTFWYTQEYMKTTGTFNWNTRIANFKFPSCGASGSVTVSPTSLTFASQTVGTTSASQAVTLSNTTAAAVSITSIAASGDFAQTNNCGTSLAANSTCTINVTFTPTASGTRTGTLTATDSAGTQTTSLTGTGAAAGSVTLSPASLTFASQTTGTTSAAQAVTLSNTTASAVSITSIATTAQYGQTNNCGTSLAANASCTINVTFSPTATGTITGTLTVTDGAGTQTTSLTGTGVAPSSCVTGTLSNGGFETGNLSCWTTGAGTALAVSGGHSGSYSAQVGSTSPSTDSNINQTFNAPAGGGSLSFWYKVVCPDTVTYDWATVTLKDNTSGTTTTMLGKTCTNTGAWVQSTKTTLTAGHSYTLTLASHDDNYAGDPTYTLYDDVAITAPDTTAPTVTVTAPANGATVSGSVTISATASDPDNPTVSSMQILVDGTQVSSNTNSNSISFAWNSASVANGSHTITAKASDAAGNVGTSSAVTVTVNNSSTQLIQNGGFESGAFSPWTTGGTFAPVVSTTQKHGGTYSAKLGASSGTEPNGDSYIIQTVTIPSTATKATLTFYYWPFTQDTITYDWQQALVRNTSGTTLATIMKVCSNAQAWTAVTYDLTSYKGQTIQLYFNAHGDGYGDYTYMYLDDVTVTVQ